MNILFFDDEKSYYDEINELLIESGHTVYGARSYQEILNLLDIEDINKSINFAVFDIFINESSKDGIDLFKEVEEKLGRKIPCLFVTVAPNYERFQKIPTHTMLVEKTDFVLKEQKGLIAYIDKVNDSFSTEIDIPTNFALGDVFVIRETGTEKDHIIYMENIYFIEPIDSITRLHIEKKGEILFSTTSVTFIEKLKNAGFDLDKYFTKIGKKYFNRHKKISHYQDGAIYFDGYDKPCYVGNFPFEHIKRINTSTIKKT